MGMVTMPIKDKIHKIQMAPVGADAAVNQDGRRTGTSSRKRKITYKRLTENESFLRWGESNYSTSARVRMYGTTAWGTMIREARHDGVSVGQMQVRTIRRSKRRGYGQNETKQRQNRSSVSAARHAVVVVCRPDGDHAASTQRGNATAQAHELRRVLGIVAR